MLYIVKPLHYFSEMRVNDLNVKKNTCFTRITQAHLLGVNSAQTFPLSKSNLKNKLKKEKKQYFKNFNEWGRLAGGRIINIK